MFHPGHHGRNEVQEPLREGDKKWAMEEFVTHYDLPSGLLWWLFDKT